MLHPEPPRKDTVPPPDPEIADDRGETKYFHGREKEVGCFLRKLSESKDRKIGTIFLVQGPPGVGKTALLAECRKRAEQEGWSTADIRPGALWDNMILRECLGIARKRLKNLTVGASVNGVGLEVGPGFDENASTPIQILQSKKAPLLLVLDEAQRLGDTRLIPDEKREAVTSILEYIHNGKMDRPLVLLAGGLGNTLSSFHSLHISRFKNNCYFEMEALTKDKEQAVIRDWLVEAGRAKGDIAEWADAISRETYGWGHHIISYIQPALDYLDGNDRKMTREGLASVLEKGRENRRQYHEDRLSGFTAKECRSLARILAESSEEGCVEQEEVVEQLDREYGVGKGEEILFRALPKGIFYLNKKLRCYSVPIPSMRDFIVKNFPPKEISEQQPESKNRSVPE